MLFFVGAFFILISIFNFIKFLIASGRPKQDVTVKDFTFAKLKGDMFGIGGDQKHARVSYQVNGQEYEADVLIGKKSKIQVGEIIRISYQPNNPKEARPYQPKKELLMIATLFILGSILCIVASVLTNLLTR